MTKKKTPGPRVTVNYGTCELFASYEMVCPLCRVTIPANTHHTCENPRVPEKP